MDPQSSLLLPDEIIAWRLRNATPTQTGVQSLSMWCLLNKTHRRAILKQWRTHLCNTELPERTRVALLYIVHDILHNIISASSDTRMRARIYLEDICVELPLAVMAVSQELREASNLGPEQEALIECLSKLVLAWKEMGIFPPTIMKTLWNAVDRTRQFSGKPPLTVLKAIPASEIKHDVAPCLGELATKQRTLQDLVEKWRKTRLSQKIKSETSSKTDTEEAEHKELRKALECVTQALQFVTREIISPLQHTEAELRAREHELAGLDEAKEVTKDIGVCNTKLHHEDKLTHPIEDRRVEDNIQHPAETSYSGTGVLDDLFDD